MGCGKGRMGRGGRLSIKLVILLNMRRVVMMAIVMFPMRDMARHGGRRGKGAQTE